MSVIMRPLCGVDLIRDGFSHDVRSNFEAETPPEKRTKRAAGRYLTRKYGRNMDDRPRINKPNGDLVRHPC